MLARALATGRGVTFAREFPGVSIRHTLVLTAPRRHMGIFDSIKSSLTSTQQAAYEKKKVELYQQQLEVLTKMTSYTLRDYVKNLTDVAEKAGGRSDWRSWLRTKAQQAEMDEQWVDLRIAEALEPAELDDPTLLRRREKVRIATAASCDVSRVNRFVENFEQSRQVHRWLQSRKTRGLAVPKTLEEYSFAMASDRHGVTKESMARGIGRVRSRTAMLSRGN